MSEKTRIGNSTWRKTSHRLREKSLFLNTCVDKVLGGQTPNARLSGEGDFLAASHITHTGCKPEGGPWAALVSDL